MLRLDNNNEPGCSPAGIRAVAIRVSYAALDELYRQLADGSPSKVKEIKEIAEVALKFLVATKGHSSNAGDGELGVSIYALSDAQLDEIVSTRGIGKNSTG